MAANTAFGTLPGASTLGGAVPSGASKPKVASAQGLAPGATPTFSQLQQQGQARPAPAAGTAAPAQQQAPMLSALNTQLSQGLDRAPANVMEQLNNVPGWNDGGYIQGGSGELTFLRDQTGRTTITAPDESGAVQRYTNVPEQPQQSAQAQSAAYQPSGTAYQSSGAFEGSSQAQALRSRLEQQLTDLSQNEAQIQGQSYEAMRKAKMAEMGAEFGAQRSQIEEDLARRGLSASTIGGGRYGDLAGQQARATATFEADLLRQQAEAEAKNRQMYLSGMSELAGMAGQQDLGTFEANLKSRQADADISLRTQELQQKAALEGRSLNLQEARDLATKEYQGGQLQQGYAEISSRERMSASDIASRQAMQQSQFGFEKEQSALERNLRSTMQERELNAEERRQLTQIEASKALQTDQQTFQGSQSQLERDLRNAMQTRELSAEEKRQLNQIEANKALQTDQQTFQGQQSQLERNLREAMQTRELTSEEKRQLTQIEATKSLQTDAQTFQGAQSKLERDLREAMQTRELTAEEKRQLNQIEANKELQKGQQTFQAGQSELERTFQGGQSQLERDLRKQLQEGQITAEGQRQLTQINATKSLQEGQQTWQAGQTEKGNTFQAEQSKLDRDLRSKLSGDEIKAATDRFALQFGLDKDRFNAETAQGRNQFLATLAQTLAPLDKNKRDEILTSLGIDPLARPASSSSTSRTKSQESEE